MGLLTFSLTSIVVFAAVFLGIILGFIAKDEVKQGRKHFVIAQKVVFGISLAVVLLYSTAHIAAVLVMFIVYFVTVKKSYNDILAYVMFGYVLFLNNEVDVVIPALIFIHGLLQGTLVFEELISKKVKNKVKLAIKTALLRYIWIIPVSVILYLL